MGGPEFIEPVQQTMQVAQHIVEAQAAHPDATATSAISGSLVTMFLMRLDKIIELIKALTGLIRGEPK